MRAAVINNEACTLISRDCSEGAIKHLEQGLLDLFDFPSNSSSSIDEEMHMRLKSQECTTTGSRTPIIPVTSTNESESPHYYQNDAFDEGMTTFAQPFLVCEESNNFEYKAAAKAAIFFNLGIAHSHKGEEYEALACFHKSFALELNRISLGDVAVSCRGSSDHSIPGPSLCAILHNIGHTNWRCGRYTEAISSYEKALDMLNNHSPERHRLDISSTLNCIAVAKYYATVDEDDNTDNTEKILNLLSRALALRLSTPTDFDREAATIINNIGRVKFSGGEHSAALAVYKKAHSIRVALLGDRHIDVAASLFNMAQSEEHQGHIREAIDLYQQYLSIILLYKGEGSKEVVNVLIVIGQLLYTSKHLDQALDYFLLGMNAAKLAFGPSNYAVAGAMSEVGNIFRDQDKLHLSLEAYQAELALERVLYPSLHKQIAVTILNIADVYQKQKKWDEALGCYEEAVNITRHNNNPRATVSILLDMSFAHEMIGDLDLAAKYITEGIDFYRALQDGDDHLLASTLNDLGVVQSKMGLLQASLSSFLDALHILRSIGATSAHEFTSVTANAADIYKRLGQDEKSLELYKDALLFEQMKCCDKTDHGDDCDETPNQKDVAFLSFHIGQLAKERGDFIEALHFLDLASKTCLDHPEVIDFGYASEIFTSLGDLCNQMGDKDKAMNSYASAIHSILCKTNPPAAAAA